jgi:hypothetical protein
MHFKFSTKIELAGHLHAPTALLSGTESNVPLSDRCGLDWMGEEKNDYFCWKSSPDCPARRSFTVLSFSL